MACTSYLDSGWFTVVDEHRSKVQIVAIVRLKFNRVYMQMGYKGSTVIGYEECVISQLEMCSLKRNAFQGHDY